jgi:hypothetical protein
MLEEGNGKRRLLPPDHPEHPLLKVALARLPDPIRAKCG